VSLTNILIWNFSLRYDKYNEASICLLLLSRFSLVTLMYNNWQLSWNYLQVQWYFTLIYNNETTTTFCFLSPPNLPHFDEHFQLKILINVQSHCSFPPPSSFLIVSLAVSEIKGLFNRAVEWNAMAVTRMAEQWPASDRLISQEARS
jgi:hypothetical protein